MVRHYKPVVGHSWRRTYTEDDMRNAVAAVRGGMTVRQAAVQAKVPMVTLHRKVTSGKGLLFDLLDIVQRY